MFFFRIMLCFWLSVIRKLSVLTRRHVQLIFEVFCKWKKKKLTLQKIWVSKLRHVKKSVKLHAFSSFLSEDYTVNRHTSDSLFKIPCFLTDRIGLTNSFTAWYKPKTDEDYFKKKHSCPKLGGKHVTRTSDSKYTVFSFTQDWNSFGTFKKRLRLRGK